MAQVPSMNQGWNLATVHYNDMEHDSTSESVQSARRVYHNSYFAHPIHYIWCTIGIITRRSAERAGFEVKVNCADTTGLKCAFPNINEIYGWKSSAIVVDLVHGCMNFSIVFEETDDTVVATKFWKLLEPLLTTECYAFYEQYLKMQLADKRQQVATECKYHRNTYTAVPDPVIANPAITCLPGLKDSNRISFNTNLLRIGVNSKTSCVIPAELVQMVRSYLVFHTPSRKLSINPVVISGVVNRIDWNGQALFAAEKTTLAKILSAWDTISLPKDDAQYTAYCVSDTMNNKGVMFLNYTAVHEEFYRLVQREDNVKQPFLVLDLGCAYGFYTKRALKYGATVIAVDMCEKHLSMMIRTMDDDLSRRLWVGLCTFPEMDLAEECLTAVLASNVIHFLSPAELMNGFRKFAEWLRPDGQLFIQATSIYAETMDQTMPGITQQMEQAVTQALSENHLNNIGSLEAPASRLTFPTYRPLFNLPGKMNVPHPQQAKILLQFLQQTGFKSLKIAHYNQAFKNMWTEDDIKPENLWQLELHEKGAMVYAVAQKRKPALQTMDIIVDSQQHKRNY